MCLFDTAAGELDVDDYKEFVLPKLREITREFKKTHPDVKVIYYSKFTHMHYLREIQDDNIDVIGVDWRNDITEVLKEFGREYMIQGNFDPSHLHLPWDILENKLNRFFENVASSGADMSRWIMGLGHGVLQHTPEENVRNTIKLIHEKFRY
jgi:uroporphyrinogen decarboxylase